MIPLNNNYFQFAAAMQVLIQSALLYVLLNQFNGDKGALLFKKFPEA